MSTHKKISFAKSTIRIFGYWGLALAFGDNPVGYFAALVLITSEVLGVIEEIGEK
jgi:hypothetical protein